MEVTAKNDHFSEENLNLRARAREIPLEKKAEEESAERAKKNPPFLQFSDSQFPDIRKHMRASPMAVQVLFFLAQHMAKDNIVICPNAVMMEEFEVSRATITRAVRYLKENNLIESVKFGTTNAYGINGEYIWRTFHHRGRYSVFENVRALASKAENKALSKKLQHVYGIQGNLDFDKDTGEIK